MHVFWDFSPALAIRYRHLKIGYNPSVQGPRPAAPKAPMKRGPGQGRDRVCPLASPAMPATCRVSSNAAHRLVGCFLVQAQARADACIECKAMVSCSDG